VKKEEEKGEQKKENSDEIENESCEQEKATAGRLLP
jgi:hypothetical protein